jgi:hypothetical protein
MNPREAAFEDAMKLGERRRRRRGGFGRNRLDLQGFRQPLNGCRIDRKRRRRVAERLRLQPKRVYGDDRDEGQQQRGCNKPDPLGRLQKSTLS